MNGERIQGPLARVVLSLICASIPLLAQSNLPGNDETQKSLHLKCIQASERAEADAAAMIPGRTWTWRLDSERSRQKIAQLHNDLTSLYGCESEFEASLSEEQRVDAKAEIAQVAFLHAHLEQDLQSLDNELQKGYPTRWHVNRDASDIQRETRKWRKLDDQIAKSVGVTP